MSLAATGRATGELPRRDLRMTTKPTFLRQELPDDVARAAGKLFDDPTALRVSLIGDMLPSGVFGRTWFLMDDHRLAVFEQGTVGVMSVID